MTITEVYKIILLKGKTLFRGINGSRNISFDTWLQATKVLVRDKYPDGKLYLSGFHVFRCLDTAKNYLNRFRTNEDRIIVTCKAKGLRKKPTNSPVWLADELHISYYDYSISAGNYIHEQVLDEVKQ